MLTSDFDFSFPTEQIALHPVPRGQARLMIIPKSGELPADFPLAAEPEGWAFGKAEDLISILKPGDLLALNQTKVLRARLHGRLESGAACEVFLLKQRDSGNGESWECLARPGKKLKPGSRVVFPKGLEAEVVSVLAEGERLLRFNRNGADFQDLLESIGEVPLPPYIRRAPESKDAETYQTVFARHPGSVAAPTASLHFSQAMLADARNKGIETAELTLHVGAGTFRPVQSGRAEDHPMHSEWFDLPDESAVKLNAAKSRGARIVAVGTTAARVLETCCDHAGNFAPSSGETRLFIRPGYAWKGVDALWTNFHWPRSTLFMLACALLGTQRAKAAYAEAIRRGFRLFSYGDAMLIL
jgi:S-adenosylmethionine:tRNA ribosyltransferase-isomerase